LTSTLAAHLLNVSIRPDIFAHYLPFHFIKISFFFSLQQTKK